MPRMPSSRTGADPGQIAVLRRAVEAFNAGRWAEAEAVARQVLASRPADPSAPLAELNPHNAASDDGLLDRFAARLAEAISGPPGNSPTH